MILYLKTSTAIAEIGLLDKNGQKVAGFERELGRAMAKELPGCIEEVLGTKTWQDITGIVVFKGPGSFTGLRIGVTVANTLAYGLQIPISGQTGENWLQAGAEKVRSGENDKIVVPEYGTDAHITTPRK